MFGLALALAFELQRADAEQLAAVRDQSGAGALGAERFRAEGLWRDDRMQPDHRRQHMVEVETVIARARLVRRRHFPLGQRGHRWSPGQQALLANEGAENLS